MNRPILLAGGCIILAITFSCAGRLSVRLLVGETLSWELLLVFIIICGIILLDVCLNKLDETT
ncbi:hypothetical protein SAMN04487866_12613 [Thermoactinomyces sp. DSM 45891]|nr:hypothetical protein SAMN04487866_12613 [Thermoactinomyces sp. DSM 45891]